MYGGVSNRQLVERECVRRVFHACDGKGNGRRESMCFFQIDDDLREEISIYVRYTTNLKEGNAIGCMVCVFN